MVVPMGSSRGTTIREFLWVETAIPEVKHEDGRTKDRRRKAEGDRLSHGGESGAAHRKPAISG